MLTVNLILKLTSNIPSLAVSSLMIHPSSSVSFNTCDFSLLSHFSSLVLIPVATMAWKEKKNLKVFKCLPRQSEPLVTRLSWGYIFAGGRGCSCFCICRKKTRSLTDDVQSTEDMKNLIPISCLCPVLGFLLASVDPLGFPSEQNVFLPTVKELLSRNWHWKLTVGWPKALGPAGDKRINPSFISTSISPPRKVSAFFQEVPPQRVY